VTLCLMQPAGRLRRAEGQQATTRTGIDLAAGVPLVLS
jgi:hypothetical protein